MVKKGKKKKGKKVVVEEEHESISDQVEEEEEEVIEFTDTSYTSASFEEIVDDVSVASGTSHVKIKQPRKKRKVVHQESEKALKSTVEFNWSDEDIFDLNVGRRDASRFFAPEPVPDPVMLRPSQEKFEQPVIPVFEKPSNWRTLRKNERKEWMENRIEQWKHEMDLQKQEELATIKQKRKKLADQREELVRRDEEEMEIRRNMLRIIFHQFKKFEKEKSDSYSALLEKEEWKRLLHCAGTPNPHIATDLHQYLVSWQEDPDRYQPDKVVATLKIVLPILHQLGRIVTQTLRYNPRQIENFKDMQAQYTSQLVDTIENVAYYLLRDIEANLMSASPDNTVMTYQRQIPSLNLNLWVAIKTFTPEKKKILPSSRSVSRISLLQKKTIKKEPVAKPFDLNFPAVKATLRLPACFAQSSIVVRAAHFELDLLSELTRTSRLPSNMRDRHIDILQLNEVEQAETLKLKQRYDDIREEYYKDARAKIKELNHYMKMFPYIKHEDTKEEIDRLTLAEPPALRGPEAQNPRMLIINQYDRAYENYLHSMIIRLRIGEMNLREYRIVNGILTMEVVSIPPQPKRCPYEISMTTVLPPRALQEVEYHVRYHPEKPIEPKFDLRSPSMRQLANIELHENLDRLVLMTIEVPSTMMCFEDPIICQWYAKKTMWSNVYINDYTYDREERIVRFRTGILWPIAFASPRYINYPLVDWEIKPDLNGSGVFIIVEGKKIKLTFLVRGIKVILKEVDKFKEHTLKDIIDKPMSVNALQKVLCDRGCDMFPDFDGYLYVVGSCPKMWPMEKHTYHAMALMSRAYAFRRSKWNAGMGFRNMILQIREMYSPKYVFKYDLAHVTPRCANLLQHREDSMPYSHEEERQELSTQPIAGSTFKYDLAHVTPRCANLLQHREDSMPYSHEEERQELSTQPIAGSTFFPDIFSLAVKYGSMDVRRILLQMKCDITETVFDFLVTLKLLSF